ncbi:MAG: S41 family peptidase [Rhodospirillales bacterium]|jgi:carboxyl-terminal processing protease|nr:S41 family peptidase [Rhodospirillales bacterium]
MTVVVGCSGIGTPSPEGDPFPAQAAAETFSVGYGNIASKYIEPVPIGELAVEGMRGLGVLDPALTVRQANGQIVLAAGEGDVARFAAPPGDDPGAWASLTAEVSRAGRTVSSDLYQASIEQIYEAVFDGALSRLDPYSRYAGREEAGRNRANRDGFGGIGIRFQARNGLFRITEVMEGTPADAVGLAIDDRITHIDGAPTAGLPLKDVIEHLRGPLDSPISLTVVRDGVENPLVFAMTRVHIVPTSVTASFADGLLTLDVHRFNRATADAAGRAIDAALQRHGKALVGVILDLRDNPGGLLKEAVRLADLFLTQGEIVATQGRHPDSLQHYEAEEGDVTAGLPLVVLVDGRSASAAEIAAAALQDRSRAVVIGTTSFGKGTVQTVIRLPNDGEVTLTWSRFVMPSGYLLHELGVHPTVCTSGTSIDGDDPLGLAAADRGDAAGILVAWRTVDLADETRRRELRAACPAQRRPQPGDLDVAKRLLKDRALYTRVLGLANPAPTAASIR